MTSYTYTCQDYEILKLKNLLKITGNDRMRRDQFIDETIEKINNKAVKTTENVGKNDIKLSKMQGDMRGIVNDIGKLNILCDKLKKFVTQNSTKIQSENKDTYKKLVQVIIGRITNSQNQLVSKIRNTENKQKTEMQKFSNKVDTVQNEQKTKIENVINRIDALNNEQKTTMQDFITGIDTLKNEQKTKIQDVINRVDKLKNEQKIEIEGFINKVDNIENEQKTKIEDVRNRVATLEIDILEINAEYKQGLDELYTKLDKISEEYIKKSYMKEIEDKDKYKKIEDRLQKLTILVYSLVCLVVAFAIVILKYFM